jgi:hypothetical protein
MILTIFFCFLIKIYFCWRVFIFIIKINFLIYHNGLKYNQERFVFTYSGRLLYYIVFLLLVFYSIQRLDVCLITVVEAGMDVILFWMDFVAINRSVLNTEMPNPNIENKTAVFTAKRCRLNRVEIFLS